MSKISELEIIDGIVDIVNGLKPRAIILVIPGSHCDFDLIKQPLTAFYTLNNTGDNLMKALSGKNAYYNLAKLTDTETIFLRQDLHHSRLTLVLQILEALHYELQDNTEDANAVRFMTSELFNGGAPKIFSMPKGGEPNVE